VDAEVWFAIVVSAVVGSAIVAAAVLEAAGEDRPLVLFLTDVSGHNGHSLYQ